MKALVKSRAEEGIWMEDVAEPTCGSNDVIIKIKKTAICGTDIHIYNWDDWAQRTIPVPMTVGHEFAGEIVEIGESVNTKRLKVGDIVSGEGHIVCHECRNCRSGKFHLCPHTTGIGVNRTGCFAEYLSMPAFNVFKPEYPISEDELACFDPYGNAVHTALSFNLLGEDVLITGAGPIGIMAASIAIYSGARHVVITDINPYRLQLAKEMAGDKVVTVDVNKESLKDVCKSLHMTEGFDVGLEMSGAPMAFNTMLENMIMGGHIAMLAIMPNGAGIDWDKVVFKGLTIKGIYGREMFETWYKGAAMVKGGLPLDKIITHRFGVDDFQAGFDVMRTGKSGKVILDWK